jgi:RHS repeat-associated protein
VGSTTTKYLVDTLNPTGYSQVVDELVSGAVTRTYTYGLQRISENQLIGGVWKPSFYGYDGHGNVRFLANTAGTLTDTYQFDAFGMMIASSGTTPNTYLYSGERFDSNLNLYHLRARYYNLLTGRFETMDPVPGKILNPRTLHKYVYAANNPVNQIDPSGQDALEVSLIEAGETEEGLAAYSEYKDLARTACIAVYIELYETYPMFFGAGSAVIYDEAKTTCYALIP